MIYPVPPVIEAAGALVDRSLMSNAALIRTRRAAEAFPRGPSGYFFECPFDARGERVDVLAAVWAGDGRRLAARESAWPAVVRNLPGWSRAVELFCGWADPASRMHRSVPLALVELDLEGEGGTPPAPGLHVCVEPGFASHGWDAPRVAAGGLPSADLLALAAEILEVAAGRDPEPGVLDRLERCQASLPAGGRLLHLSAMTSRPGCPLKLNAALPAGAVVDWLQAIGWSHDLSRVEALLARYGSEQPVAKLDVALGASPGRRLGVELVFPDGGAQAARLRAASTRLVEDGLCSHAQARAIEAWPGRGLVRCAGFDVRLDRELQIKLVIEGPRMWAKAYLGFSPRFPVMGARAEIAAPAG